MSILIEHKRKYGSTISSLRKSCGECSIDVSRITGLSKEQIAEMIFANGLEYVRQVSEKNEQLSDRFLSSAAFWNWFKMLWYSSDYMFCWLTGDGTDTPENYAEWHEQDAATYFPDRATMDLIRADSKTKKP